MRSLVSCAAFVCASLLSVAAFAQEGAPAADPPEVKRTVDGFLGKWKVKPTITLPDGKTVEGNETIECKKAAMGRAVHCVDTTTVPGMGKTEYQYLIAYDVDSKAIHMFAVGSQGEVHDHKCTWSDEKSVACETLKGSAGGQPMTEDIAFSWSDPKTLVFQGKITGKDGTVQITGTGKRK